MNKSAARQERCVSHAV
jgi:hypothetical protein